jgi:hypothetical protein
VSLPIVLISGWLIMVAIILIYLLLSRDPEVQRVRWGLFMERKRYKPEDFELPDPETKPWPEHHDEQHPY